MDKRWLGPWCLVVALQLLAWAPASADQRDPRLPSLFEALQRADAVAGRQIDEKIWAIWSEIDDAESQLQLERGSVAMANRRYTEALAAFDALVRRSPEFAEGWNKRATLFWLTDELDRSVEDIRRTLTLEPKHFGALSGLGLIFMTIGKPQPALESFEAALAVHPFLPGGKQNIEVLRGQLGDQEL